MEASAARTWSGPILDAHAHIGRSLFGFEQAVDSLLRDMDDNGVERAVLVPLKPPGYALAPENTRVAQAVGEYPDRFHGFARVDPWQGDQALAELRRAHDGLGLEGLFLHPFEEQFAANDERIFPLMEFLRERRTPLLLAGGYPQFSHPSQIGDLARQFPDVTIIATHGGQVNISGLLLADASRMLRANPNVLMETSGIYREDFIEDTVKALGPQRVVFGSNAPYMDQGFETLRVRLAHLTDTEKQAVGYANLHRILGGARRA
jgi:predicted TIM-barrel fold metal-dependent hydrolase